MYATLRKMKALRIKPASGRPKGLNENTWMVFLHICKVAETDPVLAVLIAKMMFHTDRASHLVMYTREFVRFAQLCAKTLRVMNGLAK